MALSLTAAADDDGRRLDRILRKALRDLPLSAIHRLLRQGSVRVNGETASPDRRIRAGETIMVTDSHLKEPASKRQGSEPSPRTAPIDIIFEGAGLLILNKPAGIEVHGDCSLEKRVLSYLAPKLPPSLSFRPGPLHRLDRPSSGLIAFSANLDGARVFSALIRERAVKKFYLTLVEGIIEEAEVWRDELSRNRELKKTFSGGGQDGKTKTAITRITPLARNDTCSLILAEIETGRSHQIRAQASTRGHPLLGDKKYGSKTPLKIRGDKEGSGFMLHAWRMEFPAEPSLPDLPRVIEAPLPDYFSEKIRELRLSQNFSFWESSLRI